MKALSAFLLLATAPAAAQVGEEILRNTAGEHIILPVDGRPGCRITLGLGIVIGGRSATPSPECARRVPKAADAAAWSMMGSIKLIDPLRRVLMAFDEDETALPSSPSVADPAYYLIPAQPGLTRAPTEANTAGRWTLSRRGRKATCPVTLALGGAASVLARCAALGLDPRINRWRIEGINLMLWGQDDAGAGFEIASDDRFVELVGPLRLQRIR